MEVAVVDAAVVQLLSPPQSSTAPELGTASDAGSVWTCGSTVFDAAEIQLLKTPSIAPKLGTASDVVHFWLGVELWRLRCSMLLLQLL